MWGFRQILVKPDMFSLIDSVGGAVLPRKKINTLCVFGSYDDSELYSRNRTLIDALAACSAKVVEVRPGRRRERASNHQRIANAVSLFATALDIIGNIVSLARQRHKLQGADCYFVPYPAYIDLFILQWLRPRGSRPQIIVDAFLCLHDTLVNDREMLDQGSVLARIVSWLERRTLTAADLVFIDTKQQKALLLDHYGLDQRKIAVIPVGIDESLWQPLPKLPPSEKFRVLFWGTFIPLHGVDTIIRAAKKLQETCPHVLIELIGDGQTAQASADLMHELGVTNVSWQRCLLPAHRLRSHVEEAHCVLGIFGESDKAGNVIPYKAYQALASNKILISREGPAISELLGDQAVCGLILVPPADPEALARAIAEVADSYAEILSPLGSRAFYDRYLSNETVFARVSDEVAQL
jgi:glycosyltransferase involved in cell wall biosynthesis